MKFTVLPAVFLVAAVLLSSCATTHTPTPWLENAQKIDEENHPPASKPAAAP